MYRIFFLFSFFVFSLSFPLLSRAEQFDTQWSCNGTYASGSISHDCTSYSQFPVPAFTVTPDNTQLKFATPFFDDISFHAGIGTYRIRDGDGEVFTDQSPYWYYITISQGSPETFPDDTYSLEYSIVDSSTRPQIVYFHVVDGLFYLDYSSVSNSSMATTSVELVGTAPSAFYLLWSLSLCVALFSVLIFYFRNR